MILKPNVRVASADRKFLKKLVIAAESDIVPKVAPLAKTKGMGHGTFYYVNFEVPKAVLMLDKCRESLEVRYRQNGSDFVVLEMGSLWRTNYVGL